MRNLLFLFVFLCFSQLFAQRGVPVLKNYLPKEYQGGNICYDLVQDNRGVIFFSNESGIFEFDGLQFIKVQNSENQAQAKLFSTATGRVYYLSTSDFGLIQSDSAGLLNLKSLKLKKEDIPGNPQFIYSKPDGIYFCGEKNLWRYNGKEVQEIQNGASKGSEWILNKTQIFKVSDGWMTEFKTEIKRPEWISLQKFSDGSYLIANKEKLWIWNGKLLAFPCKAADKLKANIISDVKILADGNIAVGTLRAGMFLISRNGTLLGSINRLNGLNNESIRSIYQDKQGGLWLCTEAGLTRAEINSAFTIFDPNTGLKGEAKQLVKFQNTLFVSTDRGLFFLNTSQGRFLPVKGINTQVNSMVVAYNKLIVATPKGLFETVKDSIKLITQIPVQILVVSEDRPIVWAGYKKGLMYLKKSTYGNKMEVKFIKSVKNNIHFMQEDKSGKLWALEDKGIIIIEPHKNLDSSFVISIPNYEAKIKTFIMLKGKKSTLFATNSGFVKYNPDLGALDEDMSMGKQWKDKSVVSIYQDPKGYLWLNIDDKIHKGNWDEKSSQYTWTELPLQSIGKLKANDMFRESETIIWIASNHGLIRFEPKKDNSTSKNFQTFIRKVFINSDSLLYGGSFNQADNQFVLQQDTSQYSKILEGLDPIEFHFRSSSYDGDQSNSFQYILQGHDKNWSEWTSKSYVRYNNLAPGHYKFRVKSKNLYGDISSETVYAFRIVPPWYKETWAIICFVVGGLLFMGLSIWAAVMYNSRKLRLQNKFLEETVQARTKEIEEQKKEIEIQNEKLSLVNQEILEKNEMIEKDKILIEEKNKDIMDSITYATRIQRALLPKQEILQQHFGENYFVLYGPRDLVSGDFYWYSRVADLNILVAGDCTGHGVPGAFMTMIGNTILNQIVNQNDIYEPEKILSFLHELVRDTLKQYEPNSNILDGMDLAACVWKDHPTEVHLSSANRPIYHVSEGVLTEIKPDKMGIGGAKPEKIFKKIILPVKKGDVLYFTSDGYCDQFGGTDESKFMTKRLKQMLEKMYQKPMKTQQTELEQTMKEWMKGYEQVDDMLIFGLRMS